MNPFSASENSPLATMFQGWLFVIKLYKMDNFLTRGSIHIDLLNQNRLNIDVSQRFVLKHS